MRTVLEIMLYLFFAFCIWDINWLPDVSGWARFFYAMLSVMVLSAAVSVAVEIRDSLF